MNYIASEFIGIDGNDHKPKYRQLIAAVLRAVATGQLGIGAPLPSINRLCRDCNISRDTAVKAYAELARDGVIRSCHGKGFFIAAAADDLRELRVLLLMDTINLYKEDIYRGTIAALPGNARTDMLFHHFSPSVAATLLRQQGSSYDGIGIIPPGKMCGEELIAAIKTLSEGGRRIFMLDWPADDLPMPGAFQNFQHSFDAALAPYKEELRRYRRLNLSISKPYNHILAELNDGFVQFCTRQQLNFSTDEAAVPVAGELYLTVNDLDMVKLIKCGLASGLRPGEDY